MTLQEKVKRAISAWLSACGQFSHILQLLGQTEVSRRLRRRWDSFLGYPWYGTGGATCGRRKRAGGCRIREPGGPPDHARPGLARLATRATAPDRVAEVKRRRRGIRVPATGIRWPYRWIEARKPCRTASWGLILGVR